MVHMAFPVSSGRERPSEWSNPPESYKLFDAAMLDL